MNDNNTQKRSHVGCDAKNCTYNENGTVCNADSIDVSGRRAECTGETCCSTFKTKCC